MKIFSQFQLSTNPEHILKKNMKSSQTALLFKMLVISPWRPSCGLPFKFARLRPKYETLVQLKAYIRQLLNLSRTLIV